MAWKIFLFLTLLAWGSNVKAYVPVNANMRSFSSAIKAGIIKPDEEKTLYEHSTGQPGVITEQWFTGSMSPWASKVLQGIRGHMNQVHIISHYHQYAITVRGGSDADITVPWTAASGQKVMDENMRIRIYIDEEDEASLDFQVLLAHGIGFGESLEIQYLPWGTKRISHEANGGLYDTYQIPFRKSFRVTATHPVGGLFWYIIRGVENFPLVIGNLQLPASTRLRLYKNIDIVLGPYDFLPLVDITKTAGAVYQITIATNSSNYYYLEACLRAKIDGAMNTTWLSSGTEDFFLSAYYFNEGVYHTQNSGLTYRDGKGAMSAYKFFENDPLLFSKSLELSWRCGETRDGVDGCPSDYPPPGVDSPKAGEPVTPTLDKGLSNTTVTTYTWVYEWQYT